MTIPSDTFYVCPVCDLKQRRVPLGVSEYASCARCHHVLETNKPDAIDKGLATSVSGVILALAAGLLPVLGMEGFGTKLEVSAVETAWALAGSGVWLLSVLAIAMVVVIPLIRYIVLTYVFLKTRGPKPVDPSVGRLFRLTIELQPWAMAEVFLLGVVVSLVKLGDLVPINLGLSFWALIALMLISVLEHRNVCASTVWQNLDPEAK
ncbi:MAG: paraquat-inducible protein A [Myxococcota bacterium]